MSQLRCAVSKDQMMLTAGGKDFVFCTHPAFVSRPSTQNCLRCDLDIGRGMLSCGLIPNRVYCSGGRRDGQNGFWKEVPPADSGS